jgi:hypothetical protein
MLDEAGIHEAPRRCRAFQFTCLVDGHAAFEPASIVCVDEVRNVFAARVGFGSSLALRRPSMNQRLGSTGSRHP